MHVYLVTTKRSYIENGKYLEAKAHAIIALMKTFSNSYISRVANCDSTFAAWNTLISLEEQGPNDKEKESSEADSDQACFMVQENDSLR